MKRLIALALLTAACAKDKTPAADTTPVTPAPAAAPAPALATVVISAPAEGDSTGRNVVVKLTSQNVTIAKAGPKADGVGHYHLFLDTAPPAVGAVIPAGTAKIVHIGTGDSTYTFKALTPGAHQIIAVLGYGDHSVMAQHSDTVNFVVKK